MKSSKIKTIAGRILFFIAVCFIFIMPILSFLRMSLTTDGGFGLQNYVDMLHEERTVKAVRNTLSYPPRQQSSRWRREAFLYS